MKKKIQHDAIEFNPIGSSWGSRGIGILGQLNRGCHSKWLLLYLHTDKNYQSKLKRCGKIWEADESQQ